MKTFMIYSLVFVLFIPGFVLAQPPDGPPSEEKRKEIEAMKIAFLTRTMDLSPEEAQVFWPVYNQYQDELNKLREGHRKQMMMAPEDESKITDKEAEKQVDDFIVFRQQELDIMKKYHSKFKETLPVKKVAKLYRAEDEFKRDLLRRMSERREGQPPRR